MNTSARSDKQLAPQRAMRRFGVALSSSLFALCLAMPPALALGPVVPELVTLDMPAGGAPNASSISGDGRYVAFVHSFNPTPTTFRRDVYVHDRETQTKKLVSRTSSGEPANGHNLYPHISTDGRYIAFQSLGSNLVPGKSSGIYVYDQASETLEWIAKGYSAFGISADGRYLVYMDDQYKPGTGTIIGTALHMIDRVAGSTETMNVPVTLRGSDQFSISDDGRFISYVATRRLGDDSAGVDAFVYDRSSGTSEQVNVRPDGSPDFGTQLQNVSMSADGRYVAFSYSGQQLVPNDSNKSWDVFVRDRQNASTERVSVFDNGAQSSAGSQMARISADGRHVAFVASESLDPTSGINAPGIFVRDRVAGTTRRAAVSGNQGYAASWPSISADGQYVSYDFVSPAYPNGQVAVARLGVPAGVVLSSAQLALTEGGAGGSYSLALTSAPIADVVITLAPNAQLSAAPARLTFTHANWNTAQTVTVRAVEDAVAEGMHGATLTHAAASADLAYQALVIAGVAVAIDEATAPTITPPGAPWTESAMPVSGTAAPGASVALTASNSTSGEVFIVNGIAGAGGAWSALLTGLSDGNYVLLAQASGATSNSVTVVVDSHAPVSTLAVTPAPGASGWHDSLPGLRVSAIDGAGGQGVLRSDYTLDGGAIAALPANGISVGADGSHLFCYRSVDKVNNAEAMRCVALSIDTVAPSVTTAFDAAANTLSVTALDAGSGIALVETSLDGQNWTSYGAALTFTRDGNHIVHYRARDKAGNLAVGQTSVLIATAPIMTGAPDQVAAEATAASFALGAFSDQDGDGPWSVDIDWGDGGAHDSLAVAAAGAIGALPHRYADNGVYTVVVKVGDRLAATVSRIFKVSVSNVAPSANLEVPATVDEGGSATIALSNPRDASPADTQAGLRYAFSCHGAALDGATYAGSGASGMATCSYPDDATAPTVRARIFDKDGGYTEYSASVAVRNRAPVAGAISAPAAALLVNAPATVSLPFSDAGIADTHTASVDWGDGNSSAAAVTENLGSGIAAGTHTYALPGLYAVTVTLTDKDGGASSASYQSIVVLDPADDRLAGKGDFNTAAGAMPAYAAAAGATSMQIQSEYKKRELSGSMSLQFKGGNVNFESGALAWMIISGEQAIVRGSGTINGAGNYGFVATVTDVNKNKQASDHARVRIWDIATGAVVYDNQPGAALSASPQAQLSAGKFKIH